MNGNDDLTMNIGNNPIGFRGFCEKAKHLYGETVPVGLEPGQDRHVLITKSSTWTILSVKNT